MTLFRLTPAERRRERTLLRRRRLAVLAGGWSAERPIALKSGRAVAAALRRWALPHVFIDVSPNIDRDLRRHRVNLAFSDDPRVLRGGRPACRAFWTSGASPTRAAGCGPARWRCTNPPPKRFLITRASPFRRDGRWTRARCPPRRRGACPAPGSSSPRARVRPSVWNWWTGRRIWPAPSAASSRWEREVLIERRVTGTEVTVGVLGDAALPVVEIIPRHAFYDYHSKYAPGGSRHVVPARIPAASARAAQARPWPPTGPWVAAT
jgi:D-alanine-D-alanine ligase